MLTITKKLDISPRSVPHSTPQVINVSQYDSDFEIQFKLYASTGTFTIEEGTTAAIKGTKPSGTGYSADASIDIETKTVTVSGDVQMTAAAGRCIYEIALYKDNKEINSANFILLVERAALDADTITDESVLRELGNFDEAIETAQTAATDAAASATSAEASAAAAAASAQSLVIDSTLSQAGQAADAKVVGDKIKESGNELFQISGYVNQNYVKGRQRYVDNGVEKFANHQRWISPKQGEYIELKRGDIISISENIRYHYRVCYSTDNKLTWTMSSEQVDRYTVGYDAIAWISIITATAATDDDISHIADNHILKIKRNGANTIGKNTAEINGIMDAIAIDPYANYVIEGIKSGSTYIYVNTTATENSGTDRIIEIPDINKGDAFRIKFNITAKYNLQNFDDYYFVIREIGEDDSSVLKTTVFKLSETNVADYTVYYNDTAKIIANINLKRSDEAVSAGYYQEIDYSATVIRIKEQDDIYTKAGDTWEV